MVRTIGPKPLSSSRTITLATNAVVTNMKNTDRIRCVSAIAIGEFLWILPPEPIRICSTVTDPKVKRKNRIATTQNTGLRS